ncbi:tRNA (cytidine(34)-2'-O)-methyltransferase [Candidatus Pelagibacter sp.]|nr:tRNA (cytidine(34)-2'-O)-methyltransferase [Candidatus Pelagibacter sp.]
MTQKTSYIGPKIALYQPDIPQNTAAIIRTCSCLGVKLEIIQPCGFFLSDPRFKRVVMDYMDISSIKFYQSYEDFETAKTKERIILATTKAKEVYTNFKFREDDTLLFGRESSGVPESLHKKIKYKIKIPMVRNKRSLNLATSAAIIISESLRQIV